MNFYVAPAKYDHETAFTGALAAACYALGHASTPEAEADFCIQWGAKRRDMPTLYCELGWIPRWGYQVSWDGINGSHTHAGRQGQLSLFTDHIERHLEDVRLGVGMPRGGWGYCDHTVPASELFRVPFYLCPLQVPEDSNMKHLPEPLRTPQGMIDFMYRHFTARPIYFKQHPALSEKGRSLTVRFPNRLIPHRDNPIAGLLKSPQCVAVIAGNSNVVNDALVFGKPAVALGRGFWGDGAHFNPGEDATFAYLEHVTAHQWTVTNCTPERVGKLLRERF